MQQSGGDRPQEIREDIDRTRAEMSGTIGAIEASARRGYFADLLSGAARLLRQEANLATAEVTEKATLAGRDAALVATGGVLGVGAYFAIITALIELLAAVLPRWLAAFVVGGALAAGGAALAKQGLDALRQEDLVPRRTLESVQATGEWAKDQI